MEPTGHYWLNLAHYLKENNLKFVVVNPMHVKKIKELDDNSPTKNNVKDARVIAQLVKDGRYAELNIPEGVYADLRVARKIRDLLSVDLQAVQGQIHNWIDRYFPEFLNVFKDWEGQSALQMLKLNLLPHELVKLSNQEILTHLRKAVTRAVFMHQSVKLIDINHVFFFEPYSAFWAPYFSYIQNQSTPWIIFNKEFFL
ncbi:hypothetical protein WQ54_12850 [Bacillus sp. SA1-12]|nr:hypothetical protein WQ54_12850 [Bacillus sp. SA1-12]